jgi:hypothetical protein
MHVSCVVPSSVAELIRKKHCNRINQLLSLLPFSQRQESKLRSRENTDTHT